MAWDTPAPTFRREAFEEYKANRVAAPDLFRSQVPLMHEVVDALRFPQFEAPGFEADDILATLAARLHDDVEILLVASDKDLEQLLNDRVRMYDPRKNAVIDPQTLQETKGYAPDQAIEVQTLVGDSTDNVPGVKGIGPKTAKAIILHLKDKIIPTEATAVPLLSDADAEVIAALTALGFSLVEAQTALQSLPRDEDLPIEDRVRQALAYFATP